MEDHFEVIESPRRQEKPVVEDDILPVRALHIEALMMDEGEANPVKNSWLRDIPVSVFSIPLGLAGYSGLWNMWMETDTFSDSDLDYVSWMFYAAGVLVAIGITVIYLTKLYRYPHVVAFEFRISSRAMTFFSPLLTALVLLHSCPKQFQSQVVMVIVWSILCVVQVVTSVWIYHGFFHQSPRNLRNAHPTYMMSFMGWVLLSSTAHLIEWEDAQVICFSIGMLMMVIVNSAVVSAMIHTTKNFYDDPALFLILAPIAVAAIAYERIQNGVESTAHTPLFSRLLVFADIFLLVMFIRFGCATIFHSKPVRLLGMHWTYTFPLSGLATASVRTAITSTGAVVWTIAIALSLLATLVIGIASYHLVILLHALAKHRISLNDPILALMDKEHPASTSVEGDDTPPV